MRRILLLVSLTSLLAASALADVEVYRAKYRTASELLPIAEVVMSEGGSVALDARSNSLVLVGSKAEISQALALLESQDQRLRSVRIQHETRTLSELEAAGFQIRWNVAGGGVRVGNVVLAPDTSGLSLHAAEEVGRREATQTASLRVVEGSWGRISSGTSLLVPIGPRRNPGTAVVSAESGLEVRPRILGSGQIQLELRPFQGSLGEGAVVNRSGAQTTLVVAPGETAVVGGLDGSAVSSSESFLSSTGRGSQQSQRLLLVTATIESD